MTRALSRLLRRLLVLAIGAFSVWLIVFVIFRFADNRFPWVVAVALTYVIAAYVILPRAVRTSLKVKARAALHDHRRRPARRSGEPGS